MELPADHLLGSLHGGWRVAMDVLTQERGHIGTAVVSLQRRLEQVSSLGHERQLSPVQRDRLARLIVTGTAYRSLAQRAGAQATTASSPLELGITR